MKGLVPLYCGKDIVNSFSGVLVLFLFSFCHRLCCYWEKNFLTEIHLNAFYQQKEFVTRMMVVCPLQDFCKDQ